MQEQIKNEEAMFPDRPNIENFLMTPMNIFTDCYGDLSGNEFKVLMFIIRCTYGWHKSYDRISINQFLKGIPGVIQGISLSMNTLLKCIESLEEKNVIASLKIGDAGTEKKYFCLNTMENRKKLILGLSKNGVLQKMKRGTAKNEGGGTAKNEDTKDINNKRKYTKDINNTPLPPQGGESVFEEKNPEDFSDAFEDFCFEEDSFSSLSTDSVDAILETGLLEKPEEQQELNKSDNVPPESVKHTFNNPKDLNPDPWDLQQYKNDPSLDQLKNKGGIEGEKSECVTPTLKTSKKRSNKASQKAQIENFFNDQYWPIVMKKVGKAKALQAMIKINPSEDLQNQILDALLCQQRAYREKNGENWQYFPNPQTWINGQRWEDEVEFHQEMPKTEKSQSLSFLETYVPDDNRPRELLRDEIKRIALMFKKEDSITVEAKEIA